MTPSPQALWPMKALRLLVTIRSSNVDKIMEEGEEIVRLCNYVDVYYNDRITADIEFNEGSAKPQEIIKFGLHVGDVVITKDSETPDDIAVPALVDSSAEGIVCGYHLAILRPNPSEIIGPFLFWSLKAKPTREAFGLAAQGVTRYGLTLNGIGSVNIPVPDLATQKAVTTFLDRGIARIDKLIAKKERQVELLHKRAKQAVAELVTGATVGAWLPLKRGSTIFHASPLIGHSCERGIFSARWRSPIPMIFRCSRSQSIRAYRTGNSTTRNATAR
jgi:type I restriction enzyme S subunit